MNADVYGKIRFCKSCGEKEESLTTWDRSEMVRKSHTNTKYTKEPWHILTERSDDNHGVIGFGVYKKTDPTGDDLICYMDGWEEHNKADLERIVSCVNALQGVEDPQGFVREYDQMKMEMRFAIEILSEQPCPKGSLCDTCQDELGTLRENLIEALQKAEKVKV